MDTKLDREERQLREYRRKNLAYMIDVAELVSRQELARRLGTWPNYISQIRHGRAPFTSDVARKIESAVGLPKYSLDDPPRVTQSVSRITDTEIKKEVERVLREECRRLGKPARGEVFRAAVALGIADAKARGLSESRVRLIAREFLS